MPWFFGGTDANEEDLWEALDVQEGVGRVGTRWKEKKNSDVT